MEDPKREGHSPLESDLDKPGDRPSAKAQYASAAPGPPRTLNSADLLGGAREVQFRHEEKIYRLQLTRNGKLILIK